MFKPNQRETSLKSLMPNPTPAQVIPGYTHLSASAVAPSEGIFIPLASLPGLTTALADPSTGDGRAVLLTIDKAVLASVAALTTAPTHMIVSRNNPTGQSASSVRHTYSRAYDIDVTTDNALVAEA